MNKDWHPIADPHFAFPHTVQVERYMFRKTNPEFLLMHVWQIVLWLLNQSILFIFQQVNGTLYISTPLWIAGLVESQHEPLFEIPVIQPKDTWFGPNAQQGEICYATSVDGRTDLNLLTPRAFRAVTPIDFHNTSNHQLRFDRMNVPVTALPFYSESTGRLWTSQIKVYYEGSDRPARIRIENRTPPLAGEVTYVHPPRSPGGALFNMFDSFF